jgi:DNA-binding CsgD family transcriptional regulator
MIKMPENLVLADLAGNAVYRRTWLLIKALERDPLDKALELARAADEFVTAGGPSEQGAVNISDDGRSTSGRAEAPDGPESAVETEKHSRAAPPRAQLSEEERERLINRMVAGVTNAELATELGLSSKQVQGFRMGWARKIASRRERLQRKQPAEPTNADEVIRYLRQQDDVVVPQGGEFLVNGRFRLSLSALIERANKMRDRQGKAPFKMRADHKPEPGALANGHFAH